MHADCPTRDCVSPVADTEAKLEQERVRAERRAVNETVTSEGDIN